ncbi:hypothetical protein E3O11_12865 [Cryobacterium levicorallinum]|uniref:Uncharacterized protein n=1 Tax=Cryobacterium levicorallinum TaxID=995038 RepID=A0A1I2ZZD0_9MICO|nr:hypothetical protein [Cryobacterium levicorallinum]TFB82755.1 hypothetical protein E3O11_12865 [Cryobacterium levicorallinum]GEP26455.1 hypothetical protein CLE01_10530 [Cryobacterium levicorallinum]SFH43108.1 hypothetical protein SAMN05216274_10563 [Cryobacterium levicorallinum]
MAHRGGKDKRRSQKRSTKKSQPDKILLHREDEAEWDETRHGARAGRGFTFQHLIGAWLAAGIHSGDVEGAQLVPEGLEDLSIDGSVSFQIQVKSRIDRRGPFSPREAAAAVLATWNAHRSRNRPDDQLVVVLERDIDGCVLPRRFGTSIASIDGSAVFLSALAALADKQGLAASEVELVSTKVWIMALPWSEAASEITVRLQQRHTTTPTGVLRLVERELTAAVQEAAAENASRSLYDRAALSRTTIASLISKTIELVDLTSLESAIRDGICEPVDAAAQSMDGLRYYEGIGTQPSHVASGLVVPSDETNQAVLTGCSEAGAVILHGPSGVGKSAALWSVASAAPGILWFRIRRLLQTDVDDIVRLARAWGADAASPVGFLIDTAGIGQFGGWRDLLREASAMPGLYLVATARNEDLRILGDLRGCVAVEVVLSEQMAAQIFEGLVNSGATDVAHWAEAFEASRGLTMEFTHILTRGARLQQVIDDQIRDRLEAGRDIELDILAVCGVAGRWGASMPVDQLREQLQASTFDIRRAIERLATEHMLIEDAGHLTALHRLRSVAITSAVHRNPPPTISDSVRRALTAMATTEIARFTADMITDLPDLAQVVVGMAVQDAANPTRFMEYLHGLRLASFSRLAIRWVEIANAHKIERSKQALLFQLAISRIDVGIFPERLRVAIEEMVSISADGFAEVLLSRLEPDALGTLLTNAGLSEIAQLLSELREADGAHVAGLIAATKSPQFSTRIRGATLEHVSEIIAAAMTVDTELAIALGDAAGGRATLLKRFGEETPWILESRIDRVSGAEVGFARILQHSDPDQDDHSQTVATGRRMLRLFPEIDAVDVKVLLPGGHELLIDDHNFASTGLTRRNDVTEREVLWNRERILRSKILVAQSDTSRLQTALGLIRRLVEPTRAISQSTVAGGLGSTDPHDLAAAINGIGSEASNIGPEYSSRLDAAGNLEIVDHVSGFITDLTENLFRRLAESPDGFVSLAAHLQDAILSKSISGMKSQRWSLVGLSSYPPELDELEEILRQLHAVLYECGREPTSAASILNRARSARREWALGRGAEEARRLSRLAVERDNSQFESVLSALPAASALFVDREPWSPRSRTVLYETPSISEWPLHLEQVVSLLTDHAESIGVDCIVVPTYKGEVLGGMQVRVYRGKAWPGAELADILLPLAETPLSTQFRLAVDALSQLYSMRDLPQAQFQIPLIADKKTEANDALAGATDAIKAIANDSVIQAIFNLIDQLTLAVDDAKSQNLASALVAGVLTDSANGIAEITAAGLLALEWDLNRAAALAKFN